MDTLFLCFRKLIIAKYLEDLITMIFLNFILIHTVEDCERNDGSPEKVRLGIFIFNFFYHTAVDLWKIHFSSNFSHTICPKS